jgi:hypothetical protein
MTLCRTQRWRLVAATVLGAVLLTPLDAAQARAKDSAVSCRGVTVPVSLVVGQSADNTICGRFCPAAGTETKTLQVLLHGVTYDHHSYGTVVAEQEAAAYRDVNGSCSAPDNEACTPQQVMASQGKCFAPRFQLVAHVQPGAGHDLALELNNTDGFDAIAAWHRANFPA